MDTNTSDPFAAPGWAAYAPATPPAPQQPWWQRDGVVSRLLVLAGVGVTLIGVVMLLVIAAQQGLLGPSVRVSGGGLLAVGLIAAGWRVMARPGGRIGGVALQATGFAGLYLDVLAMTSFYDWIAPAVGLVLALGIVAGGAAVAMRWEAQSLAIIVILGAGVLAPFLTRDLNPTLVAFLLILAAAGAVPEVLRGWPALAPVRTVPVVLVAMATYVLPDPVSPAGLATCLGILAVGVVTGVATRADVPIPALLAMVMTPAPAYVIGAHLGGWNGFGWYALLAAVTLAPVLLVRGLDRVAVIVLSTMSGLSLLMGVAVLAEQYRSALPLLGFALLLLAVDRVRPSAAAQVSAQLGLIAGMLLFATQVAPEHLADSSMAQSISSGSVLTAWVGVVTAALAGIAAARSTGSLAEWRSVLLVGDALMGLYAMTAGFVAAGVHALGGQNGFTLGQFLTTATCMVAAVMLLVVGLRRPEHARIALTTGLALVAAALAKLFLFDLAALDGLGRAGAFLVVGVLLLAAGTRYARSFAERPATAGV